jgi:hypothetical protein
MKRGVSLEAGQVMILVVFVVIGLVGITALAVDGGMAYSDRRHAQNTADTSALAGALAQIRHQDLVSAALYSSANNGYNNDHLANDVEVYAPPVRGVYSCSGTEGSQLDTNGVKMCNQYVQVFITSHVKTFFAPVIGINQVTNKVEAVARGVPGGDQPIYGGNAIASTNPNGCKSISYQGGASVVLTGSGIYDNSSCPNAAFFNNSNSSNQLTAPCPPGLQVVGGITANQNALNISPSCQLENVAPLPGPSLPTKAVEDSCNAEGNAQTNGHIMTPGWWDGSPNKSFPPNSVDTLESGVYCIKNGKGFELQGNSNLTGNDVVIYVRDGGVSLSGNGTIAITAPGSSMACNADAGPLKGLLLYLPPTNSNAVTFNGGSTFAATGTILAPGSQCNILGGGSVTAPLQTQFVCNNVKLGGSSGTWINYDPCLQYQPMVDPVLQLTK